MSPASTAPSGEPARVYKDAARARFQLVVDCRGFESYDKEARVGLQELVSKHHAQLSGVVFVGVRSSLVRMGAATLGMVTGMTIQHLAQVEGLSP